jgi:hypothetical protein
VPRSKVSSGRRDETSLGVPDGANKQCKEGAARVHGDRVGGSISRAALPCPSAVCSPQGLQWALR